MKIQLKRRALWPALLALALLVGGAAPGARADGAADWDALGALRKQIGEQKPAEAIEQLQEFYQSRKLDPDVAAEVVLQVAQITDVQLGKPNEALKMLDAAMNQVRAAHDPKRPVEVMYLEGKAALLRRQNQSAETIALLKDNRQMIVDAARNTDDTHLQLFASRVLNHWADALDASGAAPQETVSLLENAFNEMPMLLNSENQRALDWHRGWMYERLVAKLVEAKQFDRALQWGKLFWAEVFYGKKSIERVTTSLNSIWAAQGEFPKILAFARAQTEPKPGEAAPDNPLDAVEFPSFDADSPVRSDLDQLRKTEQAGPWRGRVPSLVTLEIALQEWEPAMKRAQQLLLSDVNALDGPQQITRIFKAKDANVVRSNQFLAYLEGKAPNPFPTFFQELDANN